MIKAPPTPKGFRDILPELAKKRGEVINTISNVLEESGFSPMETPIVEFAETLKGKYGEEEKLIYEFTDRGGRDLALRYDLTVPLARFVASNLNLIAKGPFRRYQIGQVFRGEKPQKGRWREFTQFDFDSVGSSDVQEDAKIIETVLKCYDALGFTRYKILINDRSILRPEYIKTSFDINSSILPFVFRSLDKLKKIGVEGVRKELTAPRRFSNEEANEILQKITEADPTPVIKGILNLKNPKVEFSPTLARGLDYYTGLIYEVEIEGYKGGSVAGGGRFDNLIGMFAKRNIPAVGGTFGLDRTIDAIMDGLQ